MINNSFTVSLIFVLIIGVSITAVKINISYNRTENFKKLPMFWKNSGFCPPAPSKDYADFFLSDDVRQNILIIGSIPNNGVTHLRIHWLLHLLQIVENSENQRYMIDYTKMNEFLDYLTSNHLYPTIEFMASESILRYPSYSVINWEELTYDFISHYHDRFGWNVLKNWKFETWNEPDLSNYNILNFTLPKYLDYVKSLKGGINRVNEKISRKILLQGPAGLFKDDIMHPLCWGIIKKCNENIKNCPFDTLTFHRKGANGSALEILNGGLDLMAKIFSSFPNLRNISISNDEADPISRWSEPREFQADVRYATILVNTVLQHWNSMSSPASILNNMVSLSHDNAFLSYHPFEFNQRTLLARFQLNLTNPKHAQFIQKPVYGALAMLSALAENAGVVSNLKSHNISFLTTRGSTDAPFYSCIIMTLSNDTFEVNQSLTKIKIGITDMPHESARLKFVSESLEKDVTDPFTVWKSHGSPPYPNVTVRSEMRASQIPRLLSKPKYIRNNSLTIHLNLHAPWILSVRICSHTNPVPSRVQNVAVERINENEILLVWKNTPKQSKCILSYQIYFRTTEQDFWKCITEDQRIPFLSYQHVGDIIIGFYKVRAIDIFGRKGRFSRTHEYVA